MKNIAIAALALAVGACTFGAAGRMEMSYDFHGAPDVRASADGAVGFTTFDMPESASRQPAIFGLFSAGIGWGNGGPFGVLALEIVTVPAPGGGTGFTAGFRTRIDQDCVRWSFGAGAARLIAQTYANDRVDQFGPNPELTRVYQDASLFAGIARCDRDGDHPMIGVAYEAGIAKLLFAPGP